MRNTDHDSLCVTLTTIHCLCLLYQVRERLRESEVNRRTLSAIESSSLVLSLETDHVPHNVSGRAVYMYIVTTHNVSGRAVYIVTTHNVSGRAVYIVTTHNVSGRAVYIVTTHNVSGRAVYIVTTHNVSGRAVYSHHPQCEWPGSV